MKNKINLSSLAVENIRRKPFRSFSLIGLILIFSFVLLAGSLISISLSNGVESLSDRLGADVMVVPQGHKTEIDSVLLKGAPSEFYLPADTLEKLKDIEGIEKMSPQTYIATLSASCCSYPVQVIGIDDSTDFLIKPWLSDVLDRELKLGEVIVGSRVEGEVGQTIRFFEQPFTIVGRLEQTGMGFDASVFVNRETAQELAIASERIQKHPLAEDGSLISTVMIKLKPGYDSTVVAKEITDRYANDGLFGMFSKKFVNNISSNLQILMRVIKGGIIVIWLLAVIILAMTFSMILRERKKELAVLRIIGAKKSQLKGMIIKESGLIGLIGGVAGSVLGLLFLVLYGSSIAQKMSVPFLLPSIGEILLWSVLCLFISVTIAPLASIFALRKLSKWDVYTQFREEE